VKTIQMLAEGCLDANEEYTDAEDCIDAGEDYTDAD
jgi:hypothetical protein